MSMYHCKEAIQNLRVKKNVAKEFTQYDKN